MERDFQPEASTTRHYPEAAIGGFPRNDGEIEFYLRVGTLVDGSSRVLDLGAGRGSWAVEPGPQVRRDARLLRGRVAEVVGCDVDPAVMENPAVDKAFVYQAGDPLPFGDQEFDLVIADWVMEHVARGDVAEFTGEVMRVLRPGGWFVGRTPLKWGLVGIGGRMVPNRFHRSILRRLQPWRKEVDVFPTRYAMNSPRRIRDLFDGQRVVVYGHEAVPTYFERSRVAWALASLFVRVTPRRMAAVMNVFVQKVEGAR